MRALMLTATTLLALCLCSVALAQSDGHANSYCLKSSYAWDSTVWTVSSDMADLFTPNAGHTPITTLDLIRFYDTNLQFMARVSKARFRTRVSTSTTTQCEPDQAGIACITANGDEDAKCNPPPRPPCAFGWLCGLGETCEAGQCVKSCSGGPFDCRLNIEECRNGRCELVRPEMYAGCAGGLGGSCKLVVCASPATNKGFTEQDLASEGGRGLSLARHELGHAHGVEHCDVCTDTSDGCEGELMAPTAAPLSYTFGDALGLRTVYGHDPIPIRPIQRLAWPGLATSVPAPTTTATGFSSAYPQRLDCKDGAGINPDIDCARVATYSSGSTRRIKVSRLESPMALTGAWTASTLADFAVDYHGQADVAVHHDGRQVFLGLTRSRKAGEQWVYRIDAFDGSLTAIQVPYTNSNDASRLPIRVTHLRGRDALAVWSYSMSGTRLSLRVRLVTGLNTATPTVSTFLAWSAPGSTESTDLDGDDALLIADFDVDCRYTTEKIGLFVDREHDDCVIVAPRVHRTEAAGFDGRVSSRHVRFTHDKLAGTHTRSVMTPWEYAPSSLGDSNSVTSVALSGTRMVVSTTQRSTGTNLVNRVALYSGLTTGSGLVASRLQSGDFGTACTSATSFGETVGGQTLAGAIPVAWCPTCGSGQFEAFAWGGGDASNFCH